MSRVCDARPHGGLSVAGAKDAVRGMWFLTVRIGALEASVVHGRLAEQRRY